MKLDIGDNLVHLFQLVIVCATCCVLALWTKIDINSLIPSVLTLIAALAGVHLSGMKYNAAIRELTGTLTTMAPRTANQMQPLPSALPPDH